MQEVLQPLLAKCYLFYSMPKHAVECDTCDLIHCPLAMIRTRAPILAILWVMSKTWIFGVSSPQPY